MTSFKQRIYRFIRRFTREYFEPINLLRSILAYPQFVKDLYNYFRMEGAEPFRLFDIYPCLLERTMTTPFDAHYFYQDTWAFEKIYESKVQHHVDVGSTVFFVGMLSKVTNVTFIDIRPFEGKLDRLECKKADVRSMPYDDNSVQSLSCLNVAEHIGLGQYGESLDPFGTQNAIKELSRVLAVNGNLYFSVPIGKPRLLFNGYRSHSPQQILDYFNGLDLVELSGITDDRVFIRNIDIGILEKSHYACGLFHFRK